MGAFLWLWTHAFGCLEYWNCYDIDLMQISVFWILFPSFGEG